MGLLPLDEIVKNGNSQLFSVFLIHSAQSFTKSKVAEVAEVFSTPFFMAVAAATPT